ncbi:MAG: RluA family pseudouridine synthase [Clostridia bacterium]
MRTLSLTADETMAGRTVQSLLLQELRLSGGLISRLKQYPTGICINGEKVYTTCVLHPGDVLTAEIGDHGMRSINPVSMPLEILWEDSDLLMLNKPAGLTVHADCRRPEEVTLDHALAAYLADGEVAHPVSRLDRGTTGIITYAKNGYAHELLRRIQHTDAFYREYRGIALGRVTPSNGAINLPIGFAEGSTYKRAAVCPNLNGVDQDGRILSACTEYETLTADEKYSLLRLIPRTGRTHQLRVHMAAIGYPLAGDWLYGNEREDARAITRPALHSYFLRFTHPMTGKVLELIAPLPDDMKQLLQK